MMPELYEQIPCEHPEATGPHTTDGTHRRWLVNPPDAVCGGPSYEPVDLIAAVRAGVESGTVKGERIVLDGASVGKDVPDDLIELVFYMEREKGVEWFRRGGDFILVPVSDGGSET